MGDYASSYATLGAGAYTAYSGHQSAKYNDGIQRFNAQIAELQADDAIYRGELDVKNIKRAVDQSIGTQKASLAAQGLAVDQGTAVDLIEQSRRAGMIDEETVRNNAAREAWGFQVSATNSRIGGSLGLATARNQATGTLLTAGAEAYGQYQKQAAATKASKGS